jgi:hypothetical protein
MHKLLVLSVHKHFEICGLSWMCRVTVATAGLPLDAINQSDLVIFDP